MVKAQPITQYFEGVSTMKFTTNLFSQIIHIVSRSYFMQLVRACGAERYAKGFSSWDQFVAMLFCQLALRAFEKSAMV
ncbi:DUF4372 domain-containing protein [Chloroflexota bacterium]